MPAEEKVLLSNAEVRAATKWLKRRGFETEEISPRLFAKAAKETDSSFADTLDNLARVESLEA